MCLLAISATFPEPYQTSGDLHFMPLSLLARKHMLIFGMSKCLTQANSYIVKL